MEIRLATALDAEPIAGLAIAFRNHLERSQPADDQLRQGVTRLLAAGDAEFHVALQDGEPFGYALLRFRYSMWAAGVDATLEDLFVAPDRRRQGAGKELAKFALGRARARGCRSVGLDTNENNAASNRIYAQLGFDAFSQRWAGRQLFFRLGLPQP